MAKQEIIDVSKITLVYVCTNTVWDDGYTTYIPCENHETVTQPLGDIVYAGSLICAYCEFDMSLIGAIVKQ